MQARHPIAIAFALVLAAACGGSVSSQSDAGDAGAPACPSNPGSASCSTGQRCSTTYANCPGDPPGTLLCDCVAGHFSCPQPGAPKCPPVEPCGFAGAVSDGESCTDVTPGTTCGNIACPQTSVQCRCTSGTFRCDKCPADAGADGATDAGPG